MDSQAAHLGDVEEFLAVLDLITVKTLRLGLLKDLEGCWEATLLPNLVLKLRLACQLATARAGQLHILVTVTFVTDGIRCYRARRLVRLRAGGLHLA